MEEYSPLIGLGFFYWFFQFCQGEEKFGWEGGGDYLMKYIQVCSSFKSNIKYQVQSLSKKSHQKENVYFANQTVTGLFAVLLFIDFQFWHWVEYEVLDKLLMDVQGT